MGSSLSSQRISNHSGRSCSSVHNGGNIHFETAKKQASARLHQTSASIIPQKTVYMPQIR